MSLQHLSFVMLFFLSVGFFTSFAFVRQKHMGRRYYLYHGTGAALLGVLAIAVLGSEMPDGRNLPHGFTPALGGFVGACLLFSLLAVRFPRLSSLFYAVGTLCWIYVLWADITHLFPTGSLLYPHPAYFFSNGFLSALLLGFTLAAMILGHWYLIEPKLPIGELKRLTLIMITILTIRLIVSTFGSLHLLANRSEADIYHYLLTDPAGLFLMMRWVWGLLAPAILAVMVWKTVQIRSTQSATGILYVSTVLVLGGETISQYLAYYHGIPI